MAKFEPLVSGSAVDVERKVDLLDVFLRNDSDLVRSGKVVTGLGKGYLVKHAC